MKYYIVNGLLCDKKKSVSVSSRQVLQRGIPFQMHI